MGIIYCVIQCYLRQDVIDSSVYCFSNLLRWLIVVSPTPLLITVFTTVTIDDSLIVALTIVGYFQYDRRRRSRRRC